MIIYNQKGFASSSKNSDEKEKEKKTRKTIAKLFALHANAIKTLKFKIFEALKTDRWLRS